MDGPEGQTHPELGGRIMGWLFDFRYPGVRAWFWYNCHFSLRKTVPPKYIERYYSFESFYWENFTAYHSRSYAKKYGMDFSKLCVADKLAIALTPAWLYIPLATLSGEIKEYMADTRKLHPKNCPDDDVWFDLQSEYKPRWFEGLQSFMRAWVKENNRFVSINT
jgi:hypothetical protein